MRKEVRQNLIDAGCSEAFIRQYGQDETAAERIRTLRRYRSCLLEQIHVRQKQLDCLDYLIYKVGQEAD